jgi:hypothetical protein
LAFGNITPFLADRGPALFNRDVSALKAVSIRERVKAQFRTEALYSGPQISDQAIS